MDSCDDVRDPYKMLRDVYFYGERNNYEYDDVKMDGSGPHFDLENGVEVPLYP